MLIIVHYYHVANTLDAGVVHLLQSRVTVKVKAATIYCFSFITNGERA